MFSPSSAIKETQASSLRVSRRRQREDSDSTRNQPLRKRSKLSENTFVPHRHASPYSPTSSTSTTTSAADPHVNGISTIKRNGSADWTLGSRSASRLKDTPVHEKKKQQQQQQQQQQKQQQHLHYQQHPQQHPYGFASKRFLKADGSTILTKCSQYMVKRLPALPEYLQLNSYEDCRIHVPFSSTHALAITHENAYIWDYNLSISTPEPHVISLPNLSKHGQSLPFGSVIRNGPLSDVSLVIISSSTGKIFFWESVDLAGTRNLFHQRPERVEGSVGGLLSGETIVDLIDADQAGFVIVFSTGRLAQLTTRDAQGRAQINVQSLRYQVAGSNHGLFSGLKTVFSTGGWRRGIRTLRVRPSQLRGHREAIAVTIQGVFQAWDLTWTGQPRFLLEIDAQHEIVSGLKGSMAYGSSDADLQYQVLDFVILPDHTYDGREISLPNSEAGLRVLVLVAGIRPESTGYVLVQLTLKPAVSVERFISIETYLSGVPNDAKWSPRLMLPFPAHTAFVVFGDAVAIVSLTRNTDSPESQLLAESTASLKSFQDALYFQSDHEVQVLDCQSESHGSKSVHSNLLVYLKNFGFLRIIANETSPVDKVTAQSKIEQALFYGRSDDNVIDYSSKPHIEFPKQEVETAALNVSENILSSRAEMIPEIMASMEQQLALRSMFVRRLNMYLKRNYWPFSRQMKWKLLWNAEKMHAAEALWKQYDARLKLKNQNQSQTISSTPLLDDILFILHEKYKTETDPSLGEYDQTRKWFIRDVARLEYVILYGMLAIKEIQVEKSPSRVEIAHLLGEANDIVLVLLESSFNFRQESLELYDLEDEDMDFGILNSGYESLPRFWTSTQNVVTTMMQQTTLLDKIVKEILGGHMEPGVSQELTQKLIDNEARIVKTTCLTYIERFRWCLAQDDEKVRATGRNLKQEFETHTRSDLLTRLQASGESESAIRLAEDLRDMPTLVKLITAESDELMSEIRQCTDMETYSEYVDEINKLGARVGGYFGRFGDAYATAFFDHYINMGKLARLLDEAERTHPRLTNYLRADSSRAKLSWINDVLHERDPARAGKILLDVAQTQESNWWCKKVEVSIAKLAILATDEDGYEREATQQKRKQQSIMSNTNAAKLKDRSRRELRLLEIQDKIYRHVKHAAYNPLDRAAEIQLVMQEYGVGHVDKKPALQQMLQQGFDQLFDKQVVSPAHLIDILTLIHNAHNPVSSDDICGREYLMALQVLDASAGNEEYETRMDKEDTLKLIWKRLFLRDDWELINNTKDKTDEDLRHELENTLLFTTLKLGVENGLWESSPSSTNNASANTTINTTSSSTATLSLSPLSDFIIPLQPSEVLGAGCSLDHLKRRFGFASTYSNNVDSTNNQTNSAEYDADPSITALAAPLARDNDIDDSRLQLLISRCRLDYWHSECLRGVAKRVDKDAERAAKRRVTERALEGVLREEDMDGYGRGRGREREKKSSSSDGKVYRVEGGNENGGDEYVGEGNDNESEIDDTARFSSWPGPRTDPRHARTIDVAAATTDNDDGNNNSISAAEDDINDNDEHDNGDDSDGEYQYQEEEDEEDGSGDITMDG